MSFEGSGEASKDALSTVIKELGISPEIEQMIRKLEGTKKERCIIDLEDIATEVKEKNIGNADRDKKIKETLASEYGIIYSLKLSGTVTSNGTESGVQLLEANNERGKILAERLEAVKSLDSSIVNEGLKSAKSSHPLPDDVKGNITKATGIAPEVLDATISSGTNPQVNNLVDTYYLTFAENEIKGKLPPGKKDLAEVAFSQLRASARDYGVLAPFPSKDLESRIADKPTRSQQLILSGAQAITEGRPDISIIRQDEKLFFKSPDGKEVTHTMDISKIPPEVTRIRGALRVSYTIPDTLDQAKQAKFRSELEATKKDSMNLSDSIIASHKAVEGDIRKVEQKLINMDEFSSLINILSSPLNTDRKKENCDRFITLCATAEMSGVFDAKTELKGEELVTHEGFRDYFFGQKLRATELRKKLEEIGKIEGQIRPITSEMTADQYESNIRQNLEGLSNLGINQFSSMNEVISFLMTQNGPEIGNNWSDAESINKSLGNERIGESQWVKILKNLTKIHDNIAGTSASELQNDAKIGFITRQEGNGVPRVINSIRSFKITNNSGGELSQSQFYALIQQTQAPQMNQKKS